MTLENLKKLDLGFEVEKIPGTHKTRLKLPSMDHVIFSAIGQALLKISENGSEKVWMDPLSIVIDEKGGSIPGKVHGSGHLEIYRKKQDNTEVKTSVMRNISLNNKKAIRKGSRQVAFRLDAPGKERSNFSVTATVHTSKAARKTDLYGQWVITLDSCRFE